MAKRKMRKTRKVRATKRTSKAAKVGRRSQARPERGKIHYLLRNIPKSAWKRFRDSREDARFDLISYILAEVAMAEVAKLQEPTEVAIVEAEPEPVPVTATESEPEPPTQTLSPEGIAAPGEESVGQPEAVNQ